MRPLAIRGERGFTLVELMVSVVVVGIAAGFIFRVYATSSNAFRTQSQISELQQTLRTAKQRFAFDLRMGGFASLNLRASLDPTMNGWPGGGELVSTGIYRMAPMAITNSATGPDSFRVISADNSCQASVVRNGGAFSPNTSNVTNTACFNVSDTIIMVRTAPGQGGTKLGDGCILTVTGKTTGTLSHAPLLGVWNGPNNIHCNHIANDWQDGYTAVYKLRMLAYRIRPISQDPRGVLQVSPSGGMATSDWQDLAFGFTDMQLAVQRFEPGDTADADGDGDPQREWFSGSNMATSTLTSGNNTLLQARITLVARTTSTVDGVATDLTPNLAGSPLAFNQLGDHPSESLDVLAFPGTTDKTLRSEFAYRSISTVVDLRNMGVGH